MALISSQYGFHWGGSWLSSHGIIHWVPETSLPKLQPHAAVPELQPWRILHRLPQCSVTFRHLATCIGNPACPLLHLYCLKAEKCPQARLSQTVILPLLSSVFCLSLSSGWSHAFYRSNMLIREEQLSLLVQTGTSLYPLLTSVATDSYWPSSLALPSRSFAEVLQKPFNWSLCFALLPPKCFYVCVFDVTTREKLETNWIKWL